MIDSSSDTRKKYKQGLIDFQMHTDQVMFALICKGVLSRSDAEKRAEAGADGIVVPNHDPHNLDYLPHPLQVMDEIVEAVGGKAILIIDGGFRRGSGVLKGLAFGASLVGLGRPILGKYTCKFSLITFL